MTMTRVWKNNMAEFICNLKRYRLLKDLTQEQLANLVGVRRETIMRLEKAQYNPSLKCWPWTSPGWWRPPLRRFLSLIEPIKQSPAAGRQVHAAGQLCFG